MVYAHFWYTWDGHWVLKVPNYWGWGCIPYMPRMWVKKWA